MNLYKTLNIDPNATKEQIKKAYRNLAHKWHPDKENGDKDKFTDISKAYAVLIDDTARNRYDETGQTDKIDIKKEAQKIILGIFGQIIDSNSIETLQRMDIILYMRKSINENIVNVKQSIKKIYKSEKKLSKLLKRIKHKKKKKNIFSDLINAKLKLLSASAKKMEEQIKIFEEGLILLQEYEDEAYDMANSIADLFQADFSERLKEAAKNFRPGV